MVLTARRRLTREVETMSQAAVKIGILLSFLLLSAARDAQANEILSAVVINEVAWGGAAWNHTAEWIELLNVSTEPINVDGWRLVSSDGSPNVLLHGTLLPWNAECPERAFLLLERASDQSVPGMAADIIYAGALDDSGESLFLLDAQGRFADSANAPESPNEATPWPAGSGAQGSPSHASMERIDITAADEPENWGSWRPSDQHLAASGVNGTPKQRNSLFNIPPVAALTFRPPVPRPGELARFDATRSTDANDAIASYHWDFGDGQSAEGPIVDHAFLEAGRYAVTLTVVDGEGDVASLVRHVRVLVTSPPTPDFSVVPALPDRGFHAMDVLGFQDESYDADGELLAWEWRFGDGAEANGKRVLHSFDAPGVYVVRLAVTDDQGEHAVQTCSIVILSRPPVPEFTFDPSRPNQNEPTCFDASTSWDPDGAIAAYRWDFDGDGAIDVESTNPITSHRFAQSGDHVVILQVVDDQGVTSYPADQNGQPLFGPLRISVNASPTAVFSVSSFEPLETEDVTFTDVSFDTDGTIASWEWSFGDGTASDEASPTHSYEDPTEFVVSLRVTDDNGATHMTEVQIRVRNLAPCASLSADERSKLTYEAFRLDASASSDPSPNGAIVQYEWDFDGDGIYDQTTTGCTTSHSYEDDGMYTVRCRVTDNAGGTAVSQDIKLVVVNQPPRVTWISCTPENPLDGAEVSFSAAEADLDGEVIRWFWDFGDDQTAVGSTVDHTFAADRTYVVTLTVEDDDDARSDPYSFDLRIANAPPLARFSALHLDNRTVVFDARESRDPSPDGQIAHVAWEFGDGTTCPGTPFACGETSRLMPVHFYSESGTYIVTLVVVDEQGALSRARETIEIVE